jgi:hypothetical protein
MDIEHKNNNFIYYEDFGIINDYYQMIVDIIKNILDNNKSLNLNINMCNTDFKFSNNNKIIKIAINYEHTLVKYGGRSIPTNTPFGNIDDDNNSKYLVRIDRYDSLNEADIIIDYSIPNIVNVKSCDIYKNFSKKHIYISPSIYNLYLIKENRNIITLTTFINKEEERRKKLLDSIDSEKILHINISNCFEKYALQNLYKNTKVIINIHQTPHHHTFEEFRALPALECGVIVISELSPLNNLIPYNNLIIWESYDNIISKIKEVINNYDYYHNLIFSNENINKLNELKKFNYDNLHNTILSI